MAPMEKSIKFFMMMLVAFFARVSPVSTKAKPACMKNTSMPAMTIHIMSNAAITDAGTVSSAKAAKPTQRPNRDRAAIFLRTIPSSSSNGILSKANTVPNLRKEKKTTKKGYINVIFIEI